ncbi:TetR/AcrR family transcriptional regulator [Nocardioides KLBMP 9356]|uniref:TetR/AcrR family transcriptional regulator n=1 Tax=Nocardioides potassii TaxID=2911371 RepID=A0ABS9HGW0_9ACTN|nr:TetR/AcrR family transcriptional regulator [Nocardioides potassii]MCF6379632.1 TetR/AcrR family transcriptional regulator [Nocardioides potassii]
MGRVAERRAATIDRIVATAREVITEEGAAGLTLGEVARRVGMRTPSLYGYFAGRSDLCDELFRRGWSDFGAAVAHLVPVPGTGIRALLTEAMDVSVGWALDHPADAQLMFWRPIARWQPSPSAYEPAEQVMGATASSLAEAQRLGLLDAAADLEELVAVWVALVAGVISQQLSNEPGVGLADGRTSRHRQALVRMYAAHYSPPDTDGDRR